MKKLLVLAFISPLIIVFGLFAFSHRNASVPGLDGAPGLPTTLTGTVSDAKGPAAGVTVQVQGKPETTTTAKNGSFTVRGLDWSKAVVITAYTKGYYIGWVKLDPKAPDWKGLPAAIAITLKPVYTTDNIQYPWFSFEGVKGSASCGLCHREYKEWQADAHSQAAQNQRFISIYRGTDAKGSEGQLTVYGNSGKPLPPDPAKPYYGPGYKLDNPQRAGNCASCHTPIAAKISNQKNCGWGGCHTDLTTEHAKGIMDGGVSPVFLTGDAAEGITCDFCHKVADVTINPKTNLPYPDMPGILSMQLSRPADGEQLFYGTFGDVARRVSVAEVESESEFCAACHYGVFGGVVGSGTVSGGTLIYNSYGEWLDSPYSNPKTGKTCQECHMVTLDTKVSVFPDKGGIQRDYVDLHSHYMPGASDQKLLQNAVTMKSQVQHVGDKLQVEVKITNDQTGHDIPTDAPMREMILVVEAVDANGKTLVLSQGPALPSRAGNYAAQPGKMFAKLLKDEWTGESPTAAYWRPVTIVEDTRIAALAADTTRYTFSLPTGQAAKIHVRLVFRRENQKLMQQKGWSDPDILMEEETIRVEK